MKRVGGSIYYYICVSVSFYWSFILPSDNFNMLQMDI